MKKLILFLSLLAAMQSVSALTVPKNSQYDNRMKTINYNPYDVTKITAMNGYASAIIFKNNESVIDVAVGFSNGWEVVDSQNVVYLKPIAIDSNGFIYDPNAEEWTTNLVIRTNQNIYVFDLDLVYEKKELSYAVEFKYPIEEQEKRNAAKLAQIAKSNEAAANKTLDGMTVPANWNYSMKVAKDSRNIAPSFTYDDGVRTYLGFDSTKSIPAVFYYQGDQEMMSNTNVKEIPNYTVIVVHKTAERLILRSGDQTVGIINNQYGRFKPSTNKSIAPTVTRGIK